MIDRPITLAAAGLVEAGEDGDAFEQGRFADAVLSDNDRNRPIEAPFEAAPTEQRQTERIGLPILYLVCIEHDAAKIGRG
jgi:hypothetical protein